MRFLRFFAFALIAASVLCCAHAEAVRDEWLKKYNEIAPQIGASPFPSKNPNVYEDEGMFAFLLTERSYIAVYTGLSGNADALVVEIWEDRWDGKAMTAAAIAASDESIQPERAVQLIEEAEAQITGNIEERNGFILSDGWFVTVSHITVGPSLYKVYSAIRESAYEEIMGEEFEEEEEAYPDEAEETPSFGEDEAPEEKTAPKSEKQQGKKVYKI